VHSPPADAHVGAWVLVVPVIGGLIIGLMARYGSDRIRGHGIPEAIEAILMHGSRVSPTVALLKPLSSAISIGSGGPFGAEGPIHRTVRSGRLHRCWLDGRRVVDRIDRRCLRR
jgi:chloride channel protein, CIC family